MNYLLRNKNKHSLGRRILFLSLFFTAGALVFSLFGGAIISAASPLWKGQNILSRGVSNAFLWFQSRDKLVMENSFLRTQIVSREVELAALRLAAEREARLLDMLGRVDEEGVVLATVLVRPPETPYDILVLDAGSNQGIQEGYAVRLPEGPMLGLVTEVHRNSSRVLLYSTSGQKTNAVLERGGEPVIMEGRGAGNLVLALPRDTVVVEGDRILSADVFSRLIAVVGSVNLGPTDAYKEVIAASPVNIFALRFVIVAPQ